MAAPVKVARQQTTPELSGTFQTLPQEPTLSGTLRNLPRPSGPTFRNLPEPTSGTCSCDLHRHTPELFWAEDPISLRCWGTNTKQLFFFSGSKTSPPFFRKFLHPKRRHPHLPGPRCCHWSGPPAMARRPATRRTAAPASDWAPWVNGVLRHRHGGRNDPSDWWKLACWFFWGVV